MEKILFNLTRTSHLCNMENVPLFPFLTLSNSSTTSTKGGEYASLIFPKNI